MVIVINVYVFISNKITFSSRVWGNIILAEDCPKRDEITIVELGCPNSFP